MYAILTKVYALLLIWWNCNKSVYFIFNLLKLQDSSSRVHENIRVTACVGFSLVEHKSSFRLYTVRISSEGNKKIVGWEFKIQSFFLVSYQILKSERSFSKQIFIPSRFPLVGSFWSLLIRCQNSKLQKHKWSDIRLFIFITGSSKGRISGASQRESL